MPESMSQASYSDSSYEKMSIISQESYSSKISTRAKKKYSEKLLSAHRLPEICLAKR
ncbi:11268_t:CDS:2 [Dentiscutata erythropus]|uniref:11268_t:CDS:1 n=1 Tax=Dentiscutata erythropus TaxID=1348616 RepID=A0A9N8VPT4_9GLOM|nr:11268_t:CDS:2 [Dentiscutata erythropus]